ncbi:MAG: hypothetical protein ACMUHM_00355 [Thermoplasmatota archaeon]
MGKDTDEQGSEDWAVLMMSVREWVGFDPDNDGILELRPPSDIDTEVEIEFPLMGVVTVIFKNGGSGSGYRFIDGSIDTKISEPAHLCLVHGCSVIVETTEGFFPALMEVSVAGGDHQ